MTTRADGGGASKGEGGRHGKCSGIQAVISFEGRHVTSSDLFDSWCCLLKEDLDPQRLYCDAHHDSAMSWATAGDNLAWLEDCGLGSKSQQLNV